MLPNRNQITALGLLFLLALPLCISVSIYIKQALLQHQRRERFENEHLQTINIPTESINWVEEGKEILINGKLFDVKEFDTNGKHTILTGFFDTKEDELVGGIKIMNERKSESNNPIAQFVVKFVVSMQYSEVHPLSVQNSWQLIFQSYPVFVETISQINYPVSAPPPKFC